MPGFDDLTDRVEAVIREVSASVIEPRFKTLQRHEVSDKAPGEVVTSADQEAEAMLEKRLSDIAAVPVVGEEACSNDSGRLEFLRSERAWLVDPIDGTGNFVAGSSEWAVMVALLSRGSVVVSWIWQPMTRRMYVSASGEGASCNGTRLRIEPRSAEGRRVRGAVLSRFFDSETAAAVERNRGRFAAITEGRRCAGFEYPAVVEDEQDFVMFWRTLPWDHGPGVLLLEEAGGVARRPDGTPYRLNDDRFGLIAAADAAVWETARTVLD